MTENPKLSSDYVPPSSSGTPNTNSKKPFIRRPNKRGLLVGTGIVGTTLLAFLIFDDPNGGHPKQAIEDRAGDTADKALEGRLKNLTAGVIEKQAEAPPLPENGMVPSEKPKEEPPAFTAPPPIIINRNVSQPLSQNDQTQNQIEQLKMQRLQQATQMPSAVSFSIGESSPSTSPNSPATNADIPTFDPAEKPALPNAERVKRWGIEIEKTEQETPYTLRTGFVIPAVLTVGMNSDVPGQTQAIVSQNVYDTKTGKYLLIPQGAQLIGSYQSAPSYGSKRLSIMWERLIFPDGSSMDIGGMPGTDFTGMNGLRDKVNNHWWRTLTSAFLMSVLQAPGAIGSALSMAGSGAGGSMMSNLTSGGGNAAQMMASQTGSALAAPFARNLNSSPTLIIRQGYPLNVLVNKDLVFKTPYNTNNF